MARVRILAAAFGALGLCGLLAMTNCAEPTQIIVEVLSDACPGSGSAKVVQATGIAVGTADNIESRRPSSTRQGCESPTGVGTLVIFPSGKSDDEVAIKVLGGVDVPPDRCDPPAYAGCIVHRRMMRFIPYTTQRATVRLTVACLNRECPTGTSCDNGLCVRDVGDPDVPDGGANPDAAPVDAASADPRCAGCKGVCAGGTCTVDCSAVTCAGEVCAPSLPCRITCPTTGSCKDIACTTDKKCAIACGTPPDSCRRVACKAADCDVSCIGDSSCNTSADISLVGTTSARLECMGKEACRTAKTSCASKSCTLTCTGDNACPGTTGRCTGGCSNW